MHIFVYTALFFLICVCLIDPANLFNGSIEFDRTFTDR